MSWFDHHVHCVVSGDSAVTLEERARTAGDPARPHGISDHFPSTHLRDDDDVLRYIERAKALGLRVALEYDAGVAPALRPSTRDALDYLVGGVHQVICRGERVGYDAVGAFLKRRAPEYAERARFADDPSLRRDVLEAILEVLAASFERDRVDVLAHPTLSPLAALGADADEGHPAEWRERLVELCVRHDVALEVNESYRLPGPALLGRARDLGARFAVGSDSHAELLALRYTERVIAEADIAARLIEAPRRALRSG